MKILYYIYRNFINSVQQTRMVYFLILMFVTLFRYNHPLIEYSIDMDYRVGMWVFPFVMASYSFLAIFYFSVIYVNSDIPFDQKTQMNQILRLGRKNWIISQIGSLFLRSFTMVVMTLFLSIVTLLPRVELSLDWGKLIQTIAFSETQTDQFRYVFMKEAFVKFSPLQLTVLTILICTLIVMSICMLMLAVSVYANRTIAISVAVINVILLFVINNFHPRIRGRFARYVITSWAEVARSATPSYGFYWLPPILYMVVFLLALIIICCVLVVTRINRIEFQWENDEW